MMKKEEDKRRSFLKHILAGTAAVVGIAAIVKPVKAKPVSTPNNVDETLYYESENFKKYYKTLRS
ncbi:twin-arginine translocation signal domain-containing protein [Desulfopila sp. IMCC35006]|uniref:twin-arginine translocation signal domain-containing protein n=1 Tax=Desulfopila sp. IMCC35006 TaxID=2569542 RepID=UPI00142EFB84|nr:twin-arginine translocation signal domain-containing protein [Desulfopila sp. IMCC35006]